MTSASASSPVARSLASSPGLVAVHPFHNELPASWVVATPVEIGRSPEAQICLSEDSRVSRHHARITPHGSGLRVADLQSRHGTFVDGVRVTDRGAEATLNSVLRVGHTLLLVVPRADVGSAQVRRIDGKPLGLPNDIMAGPHLFRCWQLATRVAALRQPALVVGETGSGKEALARVLHATQSSPGPFVALNVSAIPASLFEATLFGHERGAFTGAGTSRLGAFREASGGVLFLDEVGDLRPELQASLLRAIDQRQIRPLGANQDIRVDVRVVAATSRNLVELCERGLFRKDLFYRLSGIVINVPALRERRTDILAMVSSYLALNDAADVSLSVEAAEQLLLADWEGNVRQLHNTLTQALVQLAFHGDKQLRPEHLPELTSAAIPEELTRDVLTRAMSEAQGNASSAARLLGVSRSTLYNLFRRHGIEPSALRGDSGG